MTKMNLVAGRRLTRVMARFALLIACASALVLTPVAPALAALTCIAGNVTLNYGAYDVLAGAPLDAAGTITVTCKKTGGTASGDVNYAVTLTPLTPRELAPPIGADRLSHQLYVDSARTQPWGNITGGTSVIFGTVTVPAGTTKSDVPQNFYGRIAPAGQDVSAASPGPPPTTYSQTFTVTVVCIFPFVAC